MDFHAMKRKKLQSLCKKHGIPANLKNKEMADKLSFILNKGKENDVSCNSCYADAGTDQGNFQCVGGEDLLNEENGEQNSNHCNNDLLVASNNVAGGSVDASEEKIVSSGKRSPSPNLEERVGFSPKHFKSSEIKGLEPETNFSPEITRDDDIEICDVEEKMQGEIINKEQVDEIQEGLHSAPGVVVVMEDLDLVNVAMEESGNRMEKTEAEKLVENIGGHDYVCGDGVAKQGDINSPKGSNMKEQVENSEFGNYLVEGEVENMEYKTPAEEEIYGAGKGGAESDKQDDPNSLPGSEMNDKNLPHVSLEESGYPAEEEIYGTGKGGAESDKQDDPNSLPGSEMNDKNLPHVSLEESGYPAEEDYGTGKGGPESDKQDDPNSLPGSEMNDKNLPHVSPEESGYPLVDGEAQKSDETICVHDGYNNFQESGSEVVDTMCFDDDTSIAAKDSYEKTNVTKHFPDEVHSSTFECSDRVSDQFLIINPLIEGKSSDLNSPQMVVSGNAAGNADVCEAKISTSPDSEKTIGFSADLLNDFETNGLEFDMNLSPERPRDDIESFDEEEVFHAAPSEVVMNDMDLGHVSLEVFGNHLEQGEFEKLADKTDPSEGACRTGNGAAEAEKHDDTNRSQGSNMDDDDVNPEESGYPLVEAELLKSDDSGCVHGTVHNSKNSGSEIDLMRLLDSHINAKDSDGKTNFAADHFPDKVHSSYSEYSYGMPDQFPETFPPSEVKSSHFDMNEMVASDAAEEKLESSYKKELVADPEECMEFYSMQPGASEIKEVETQTSFDPSTLGDIVGTCIINESMKSAKTDTASGVEDIWQEKWGLSVKSSTPVADSEKRNKFFPKFLESSMMKKEMDNAKNSALRTARDILGTCDMKENINTAKKEQFGSTISKKTFTKRQPLQDLQQN